MANRTDGTPVAWASVMGGHASDLRKLAAEKMADYDPAGYVLNGFEGMNSLDAFIQLTEATLQHLPVDKPKLMTGIVRSLKMRGWGVGKWPQYMVSNMCICIPCGMASSVIAG